MESPSSQDGTSTSLDSEEPKPKAATTTPESDISGLEGKVFKGYKGNKNQYRVVNGKWQRKKPNSSGSLPNLFSMSSGDTEWREVKNPESISNLNKEFLPKKRQQVPGLIDPTSAIKKVTGEAAIITDQGTLSDSQRKVERTKDIRWMGPSFNLVPRADNTANIKITAEAWNEAEQAKQNEVERLKKSNATPGQISKVVAEYDNRIELISSNLETLKQNEAQNEAEVLESIQNWQESDEHKDLRLKLDKEIPAKIFTHERENVITFMDKRYRDLGFTFVEPDLFFKWAYDVDQIVDGADKFGGIRKSEAMEVISHKGKSIIIDLNVDPSEAEAEAKKLRSFILSKKTQSQN